MAAAKALFCAAATMYYHHGSFVGQYCQGQAQEITVEVILCKYSRHILIFSAAIQDTCQEYNVFAKISEAIFHFAMILCKQSLVVARKLTTS